MPKNSGKNLFKAISNRAQLLLSQQEDYDVEFKSDLKGLDSSDIVAFANSETGGSILIGVKEIRLNKSRQKGEIVGCPFDDGAKLMIINKAESCIPPVELEVFVENYNRLPFLRVEIPNGSKKPYCTSGGTYKIRGDGRNKALLPGRLLTMFMEVESQQFIMRFREATQALEGSLVETKAKITEEMNKLLGNIQQMEFSIDRSLSEIFDHAQTASDVSHDAAAFSDETLGTVHELGWKVEAVDELVFKIQAKVDALLKKFRIEDPIIAQWRQIAKNETKRLFSSKKRITRGEVLKKLSELLPAASVSQLIDWYEEEIRELKKKLSPSKG